MTLKEVQQLWRDTPARHHVVNDAIIEWMAPDLNAFRDFIERASYGFGERVMYGMWELLLNEIPGKVKYLEIGVHRGATLALMGLLATNRKRDVSIFGISPMDGSPDYIKRDFHADIVGLWDYFNIKVPYTIIEGYSTDPETVLGALNLVGENSVDLLYIDGSHKYADVLADIVIYVHGFLKPGGFLVMDDAACNLELPPNWFPGHQSVTDALTHYLHNQTQTLEFIASVSHNMIFRKKYKD